MSTKWPKSSTSDDISATKQWFIPTPKVVMSWYYASITIVTTWYILCKFVNMVSIRIDIITSDGPEDVVRLSGRLTEGGVKLLEKACYSIGERFVLDLSGLLFVNEAGINAIQELKKNGFEHRGASPFIQLLLEGSPVKKSDYPGVLLDENDERKK